MLEAVIYNEVHTNIKMNVSNIILTTFYINLMQIGLTLIKCRLKLGIFEENMTDLKAESKLITLKRRTIIHFGVFFLKTHLESRLSNISCMFYAITYKICINTFC